MNQGNTCSAKFISKCGKMCNKEWLENRLKLVLKKGALKLLDNWQRIMLIGSPSNILSAVMENQIQEKRLEPKGLEE